MSSTNNSSTTMAKNQPSLCIPRAYGNIDRKRVMAVMKECDFGVVDRIDEISRKNDDGEVIKRFFVHFKQWNKGWESERKRLMSGDAERLKVVYDGPWYWLMKACDPKLAYTPKQKPPKKVFVHRDQIPKAIAVDSEQRVPSAPVSSAASSAAASPQTKKLTIDTNIAVDV